MSKLDDIIKLHRMDTLELAKSGLHADSETHEAFKSLMLELIKETEDDPEIYFGDGQHIIEERIKAL